MMLKVFCVVVSLLLSSEAFSQSDYDEVFEVNSIEIQGNGSTKKEALIEILPRQLPTALTNAEIAEYSRRIKNLGIFDFVKVSKVEDKLLLEVRRKATLSPIIGLSTGKTIQDTSAVLGVNEHDFLGTGTKLGGKIGYNDRNLNFMAWINEHSYRNNRWSRELEVYGLSSSFRFNDDEDDAWTRDRLGGFFELVSPFKYDSPLLYEFQVQVYREDYSNVNSNKNLDSATYFGTLFEVIYDRYSWDDLNPHGFKGAIEMRPGMMTNGDFRGEAAAKFIAATPLAENTSLVMNGKLAAVNSGNVNHSLLIGSQSGVRGLDDSFFRTSALGYLNLEVRHSMEVWERTFIQPVLFVDMARFRPMDMDGNNAGWVNALSTGAGVRVIPTGFTNLLLRADMARLHTPSEDWLFQVGITQYF
ncbi:MAG: hypothetical protein B7Y30_11780 [Campylobacterales bacterium 16-40-21]|nr:MAG: hypothetical protein B7Y30_11780 [Campylobacterales bacterium 16-40-21]